MRHSLLLLLLLGTFQLFGVERKPIPDPSPLGYVHDYANVLSEGEEKSLFRKLKDYEDSTSTQIGVILETTLNGRDPFDRAMDFARPEKNPKWKGGFGQEGKRNGVVMYFAMKERKIFILPADKTQGNLPDGLVSSLIRNHISPHFKVGDYYAGIDAGIDQIILALAGEFKNNGKGKPSWVPIVLFFLFVIFILYLASKGKGGRGGGYHRRGTYWFPTGTLGGGGSSWSGGGGGFGGFGGGGGFNGGGAGGGW